MTASTRARLTTVVALTLVTLACGSPEPVELALDPGTSGEAFALVNRTGSAWTQVAVRVTGDGRAGSCFDDVVATWGPGEARSFPRCGERSVMTLTVAGRESLFVVGGGTLYRKLGRREIPVRP